MADRPGHLRGRRFAEYLAGLLGTEDEALFEAHIAICPDCADRLQHEAMLDVLLHEAAEPPRVRRLPRVERVARWACAAMAMAAAILFMLADPTRFLQMDSAEGGGLSDDVIAVFSESVCQPPMLGEDATCEEPITVAMASFETDDKFGFESFAATAPLGGGCWLDEQMIDPLCVTTDPLAG